MTIFQNKKLIVFITILLILTAGGYFSLALKPAQAAWYTTGGTWNYRQQITIDHTKVPNTDQSNFPVLIKITDAGNTVFTNAQADGDDILFTQSDETTKISHEIEKFDPATHELIIWVKTNLSHTADTILYMYYGNASAGSQQNPADVWSNGYAGVWHLNDAASPALDSTSHNNDAAQSGGVTFGATGKIDGATSYSGSNYLDIANESSFDFANSSFNIEGWIKSSGDNVHFISKGGAGDGGYNINIGGYVSGKLSAVIKSNTGTDTASRTSSSVVNDNIWHHFNVMFTTSTTVSIDNNITIYIDSQLNQGAISRAGGTYFPNNVSVNFGRRSAGNYFLGSIDDTHISTTARTPDWIATEFNNQNDPGTFFTLGGEAIGDMVAPTNPTGINGYSDGTKVTPLVSGNFYDYHTPYFEWPAAEAVGGAHDTGNTYVSGVAGYYSYFGTSCGPGGGNPTLSRGVLSDTGGGLHYSTDTNITVPDLTTNNGTYCLRMKTVDNAGNIQSDIWEAFIYGYDISNPNPPLFIAVNPAGYSAIDSFDFSWPAASDVGGSGIQGYQYKRGNGEGWSAIQPGTSVNAITSYQTGENIFIVRSVDNVGHTSSEVQTTYYFSDDPPGAPTNLTADPELDDVNAFSFSWDAPAHTRPIVDYGYVVNAVPTALNLTWTGSDATTLPEDAYATQQGVNTLYVIAKDDAGVFDITAYDSVEFNCTTVAPPIPIQVSITDSSDQVAGQWRLTLQWAAGVGQGASFDHYLIERSTNGVLFADLATTTSTAYIDTVGLNNTTTYYYQIKSVDNAGSSSTASTIVSKIPTGKFTTAPTIVSGPTATALATTATITWVVNRESTGGVRFGTSADSLNSSQVSSTMATEHTIELTGLESDTTYYYQVQALDALRDYTLESAYSATHTFTTLAAPVIANVAISNITLTTADISWETTSASNTKVYYGTSINYGTIVPESETSMTTRHSIKLIELTHTTKYHFKISGPDVNANNLSSDDYTFETVSMPVISNILFTSDFSGPAPAVKITWLTDSTPTTSSVSYRPYGEGGVKKSNQSNLVEEHMVNLTDLKNNVSYEFTLSGVDNFGNEVVSDLQIFETKPDARAPQISNILIESSNVGSKSVDESKVIISWETDEPTTGQVAYGEGLSNNDYPQKTPPDMGLNKKHLMTVSGLKPQAPYHFKIIAKDDLGNVTESGSQVMISGQVNESVLNLVTKTLTDIFGWIGKMW